MERFSKTLDEAFALLVRSSQDTNGKLHTVARFLAEQVTARSNHPWPGTDPSLEAQTAR